MINTLKNKTLMFSSLLNSKSWYSECKVVYNVDKRRIPKWNEGGCSLYDRTQRVLTNSSASVLSSYVRHLMMKGWDKNMDTAMYRRPTSCNN